MKIQKKQRQRSFIRNDLDCLVKAMRTDKVNELRKKLSCNVIDVFNNN